MPRVGGSSDSSTGTSTSTDSDTDTETETDTGTDNRRAAVESDPGDVSGGSSVDTTPDTDTSNREAAVELDTGRDVSGPTDPATDTSQSSSPSPPTDTSPSSSPPPPTDTSTSNRQEAVDTDPGNNIPSSPGDTTSDDNTTNREAAFNNDPAQQIDRTLPQQASGSDPTGARQDAVANDLGNDIDPGAPRPDVAPGDARTDAFNNDPGRQFMDSPAPEPTAPTDTIPEAETDARTQDDRADRIRDGEIDPNGIEKGNDIAAQFEQDFISTSGQLDQAERRFRSQFDGNVSDLNITQVRSGVFKASGVTAQGRVTREISVFDDPDEVRINDDGTVEATALGLEELGANPTANEIRKQLAAENDLKPAEIEVTRDEDGTPSVSLSDFGKRNQAAESTPTLDVNDLEIQRDGSLQLTDSEREQRIRSQAALESGVSQEEVNVFGDADGDLSPSLTDDGFESAATRQAARQSDALEADDFQVVERNGERFVQPTDDGLVEAAAETTDNEAIRESDLQVVNTDDGRAVQLTEDGRERLAGLQQDEEQFGDFEIFLPGLNRSLEEISGDAAEGVQETFDSAAEGIVSGGTSAEDSVSSALSSDGRIVRAAGGAFRGAGDLVAAPFTAFNASKEGIELVGYGANETIQGRGGEFVSDAGQAGTELAISAGEAFSRNPYETGGRLASGAALTSGAISGAARLGGTRAGRITSAAIQPGEELARFAARTGRIDTSLATKVPGVTEGQIGGTRRLINDDRGQLQFSGSGDGDFDFDSTDGGGNGGVPDSYGGGGDTVQSSFDESVAADLRQDSLTQAQDQLQSTARQEFEAQDTGINEPQNPFNDSRRPEMDSESVDFEFVGPRQQTTASQSPAGQQIPTEVTEQFAEARQIPDVDLRQTEASRLNTDARRRQATEPEPDIDFDSRFDSIVRTESNIDTESAFALEDQALNGFDTRFGSLPNTRTEPAFESAFDSEARIETRPRTETTTEVATETDTRFRGETRTEFSSEFGSEFSSEPARETEVSSEFGFESGAETEGRLPNAFEFEESDFPEFVEDSQTFDSGIADSDELEDLI